MVLITNTTCQRMFNTVTLALLSIFLTACDGAVEDPSNNNGSSGNPSTSSSSSSSNSGVVSMVDKDFDGIQDTVDQCLNTAASDKGLVDTAGCSDVQRGKKAYKQQNCGTCHGSEGEGSSVFPVIRDYRCAKVAGKCGDAAALSAYIALNMPTKANPCKDVNGNQCASDVAAFMVREFAPVVTANDQDNDGINDDVDQCDNTLPSDIPSIDATGCKTSTNATGGLVIAVNAGGAAYTAKDGTKFLADSDMYHSPPGNVGGTATDAVANTEDDPIYAQEVYVLMSKPLVYSFDVPNGKYKVVMHFAESAHDAKGQRIIDVTVENTKVLTGYDVFDKAGGKARAVKEETKAIAVSDKKLTITITPTTHNATMRGIEVYSVVESDGDKDGVPDRLDSCPGSAVAVAVNIDGCSDAQRDKDGDGILVPADACPNTPSNQIASIDRSGNLAGCSERERQGDDDGDGVANVIDQCNSSPGEIVGRSGCSGITSLSLGDIVSPQMRLTQTEFTGAIKAAFNKNSVAEATFQADSLGPFNIFINNAADQSADFIALVIAAQAIAKELAVDFAKQCNWASNARQCVNNHLAEPLKTLYRLQTVPDSDLQAIASIVTKAAGNGATVEQAVGAGIARALIDLRVIYQLENGIGDSSASAGVNLTAQEFVNRLAFFLTDTAPDSALGDSLNSLLGNKVNITAQVERLMLTDDYNEVVWQFVSQWLGIASVATGNVNTLERAALEETRRFIKYILVDGNGDFGDLFTANYSFINKTLAAHYGVKAPDTDWELYQFPAGSKRQGILTQASFLTGNGKHGRNVNVIFRGKIIFERLFCDKMPDVTDPALLEQNDSIDDRSVAPACKGCHAVVDPMGRIFDLYNDTGKLFATSPVEGFVSMGVDVDGDYMDAVELSSALGDSKALTHCFTRQLYRFALGRDPKAIEKASFEEVRGVLDDSGSFNKTIQAFTTTQSFAKIHSESKLAACPR